MPEPTLLKDVIITRICYFLENVNSVYGKACCFEIFFLSYFQTTTLRQLENVIHSNVHMSFSKANLLLSDDYLAYGFYMVTNFLVFFVPIAVVNKEVGTLFNCWHMWAIF